MEKINLLVFRQQRINNAWQMPDSTVFSISMYRPASGENISSAVSEVSCHQKTGRLQLQRLPRGGGVGAFLTLE